MAKKVEVTYKQVGRNLNVYIDGEVITKTGTKEELAPVKDALKVYLEKPLVKNLNTVKSLLKPVTTAKKEEETRIKAEIKRTKRTASKKAAPKKEESFIQTLKNKISSGELSEKELKEVQNLISGLKLEPVPETKITPRPYRGEH